MKLKEPGMKWDKSHLNTEVTERKCRQLTIDNFLLISDEDCNPDPLYCILEMIYKDTKESN